MQTATASKPRSEAPLRCCARCRKNDVFVERITRHYWGPIPSGSSYDHRCHSCQAKFKTLSIWRLLFLSAWLSIPLGGTTILMIDSVPGMLFSPRAQALGSTPWVTAGMCLALELLFIACAVWLGSTVYRRFANPVVSASS